MELLVLEYLHVHQATQIPSKGKRLKNYLTILVHGLRKFTIGPMNKFKIILILKVKIVIKLSILSINIIKLVLHKNGYKILVQKLMIHLQYEEKFFYRDYMVHHYPHSLKKILNLSLRLKENQLMNYGYQNIINLMYIQH